MADDQTAGDQPVKVKYQIKVPENLEQGVFADAVSVHFNNNACTLDLAYRINNPDKAIIKVVSRVNMTHTTAKSLIKVLSNALLDFENKKKESQ